MSVSRSRLRSRAGQIVAQMTAAATSSHDGRRLCPRAVPGAMR